MLFLVTGVAGFIGSYVASGLLDEGHDVIGIDNLNDYYDVGLKQTRLLALTKRKRFQFEQRDLEDPESLISLSVRNDVDRVVHLAAQAGVRYSLEKPFAYLASNITGHLSVLEFCRHAAKRPFLAYASSSSVYGNSTPLPFSEDAEVRRPVSLYAATKIADELMSETYASLYGLRNFGMRFFTVYGPWGRPDMAYWSFTEKILKSEPIRVFNGGQMRRDFTFIDDAVSAVLSIALAQNDLLKTKPMHRIYNIGHNQPVTLLDFIAGIEGCAGVESKKIMEPMQPGDVAETCADISRISLEFDYQPQIGLREGLTRFVDWFRHYSGWLA
ncbi:MAG: NAD-dependent epimerase/dehydratase family protein [Pseudomonadota bacterium]